MSIHTGGLRIGIDVIWCARHGLTLRVDRAACPWRVVTARSAEGACEGPAGGAIGLQPGDHLDLVAGDIMKTEITDGSRYP
jgi:hypothetical protein